MKSLRHTILGMLMLLTVAAAEERSFTSEPFSLQISAPLTWKMMPSTFPTEKLDLKDRDLEAVIERDKTVPIVSIVKPIKGRIVPAIQVYAVPSDGMTPKAFLSSLIGTERQAFADCRVVLEPRDTRLNDIEAAASETSYTAIYPGGRSFQTISRKWAIPRKTTILVVVLTGTPEDLRDADAEVKFILRSIRFTKD